MKTLIGKSQNIEHPIIGKITRVDSRFKTKKDTILLTDRPERSSGGYSCVISGNCASDERIKRNTPCVYELSDAAVNYLHEGDVVVVEPDGHINIMWEIESHHNSILVTETCNCRCIACPQPSKRDPENLLSFNLKILHLVDPAKVTSIGITGGEPTLRPDDLTSIIKSCKKRFSGATISLLSNGRGFSNRELVEKVSGIDHPCLTCCISLYSDTDTEHDFMVGSPGAFNETLRGLHNLALLRQRVEIRVVIMKQNYHRLPSMAEFIYRNFPFAVHIALMGLEVTGLANKNIEKIWIDPSDYSAELKKAVVELWRRDMNVSIYNLPLCLIDSGLWRFSKKSISSWKNIYLEQCNECKMVDKCGGVFETSERQSENIKAII